MNVGDPKKAAVLGAVALVVVGAAVFQALPKGAAPAKAAGAAATGQQPVENTSDTPITPTQLVVKPLQDDPFAHPSLKAAENPTGATTDKAGGEQSEGPKKRRLHPPQLPPEWPDPTAWERYEQGVAEGENLPKVKPGTSPFNPRAGDVRGTDQESIEIDKKVLVVVQGIVSVDKPKAFLSVDGKEKTYKTGDQVGSLGKVVRITENEVVIERDGKKHVVQVGKQVKL